MKIRSQFLVTMVVWGIVFTLRAIMLTCRKVYVVSDPRLRLDHKVSPDDPERFVGTVWHDQMLIPTLASHKENRRRTSCLVSQHQDGGYLAEFSNSHPSAGHPAAVVPRRSGNCGAMSRGSTSSSHPMARADRATR